MHEKNNSPDTKRPTVFVIDDEEVIREMATDMLNDFGYEVVCAGDGEEALELFRELAHKIDVVLLDMIMPGLNGREILGRLQQIRPDVKVILSSGFTVEEVPKELLENSATDFIEKPYRIKDLLAKIDFMIKGQ